jgi:hypothetical protein
LRGAAPTKLGTQIFEPNSLGNSLKITQLGLRIDRVLIDIESSKMQAAAAGAARQISGS